MSDTPDTNLENAISYTQSSNAEKTCYYTKYNVNPGESLIFLAPAFHNTHAPNFHGSNPDVKKYQELLEQIKTLEHVHLVNDLNAHDEKNAHQKYIFEVKPKQISHDIIVTRRVKEIAKVHGFKVKDIVPHHVSNDMSPGGS